MKTTKRRTMIHKIPHRKLLNKTNPTKSWIYGAPFIFCVVLCEPLFIILFPCFSKCGSFEKGHIIQWTKRTNNNVQNITQKTKDCGTRTPLKSGEEERNRRFSGRDSSFSGRNGSSSACSMVYYLKLSIRFRSFCLYAQIGFLIIV